MKFCLILNLHFIIERAVLVASQQNEYDMWVKFESLKKDAQ